MGLRSAINQLNEAVTDLTSLHVQTYSGRLSLDIDESKTFDELRDAIKNADKGSSDVNLVAESLLKFDGDSYHFAEEDAPPNLLRAHNEAVKSGLEARLSIIELFKDAIGG